jgi:hypothetical protein
MSMVNGRMSERNESSHRAYAVKRERRGFRWVEIGVALTHDDGKGFDVYLDRLPVGGFNGHILVRRDDAPPDEVESFPIRPAPGDDP